MAPGQRPLLLDYLRRLSRAEPDETADAQLLERFACTRDEAAFAGLLQRHGPLVWSVCRRMLGDDHAAEDAFQATFLVLVKKARAVSKRSSIRSWLYGVALRVAARARQREGRRRAQERNLPARPSGDALAAVDWSDLRPILDEEIGRLPEKYRLPVILCYLEGRTNDEAALDLRCPRGTIATRLARARERLRTRLARRGVTLSATALGALLADNAASAAVPPALMQQTTRNALLVASVTAAGGVPASITTLMEGVLHAMSVTRTLTVLAAVLALTVLGGAGACAVYLMAAQELPQKKEEARPPADKAPEKEADPLKTLMEQRLKLAQEEVKLCEERLKGGWIKCDQLAAAARRLLKAELELATNRAARIAAHEKYINVVQRCISVVKKQYEVGRAGQTDVLVTEYTLIDAKIDLEREKARK